MTGNLSERVQQHHLSINKTSFAARYKCYKLIYWGEFSYVLNAIEREKQIKRWNRSKKIDLISRLNSEWKDLSSCY